MNQNYKKQIAALLAIALLCGATAQATVDIFISSGTWQCPADVTTVTVECWGGGGAGGSARRSSGASGTTTDGGGGAGGAYVLKSNITVVPGNFYTVTVGSGGIADAATSVTDGDHGDGSNSWFNDISTVLAKGGNGGISKNTIGSAAGAGGLCPSGSIGDTIYLGGNGASGTTMPTSGGGGGSGGTSSGGNSASGITGGAAVTGGGAGATGRITTGSGSTGNTFGGGGSGAQSGSTTGQQGGAGAAGKVAISYVAGTTYTWVATSGSADWTLPSSWLPSRTSPLTNDVLIFNQGGNSTAINVPTETDGKLQISNDTILNLQAGGTNTLNIGETASDSLTVGGNSQLNVNGPNALNLNLSTGARGSINGSMTFSNAADTLTAVDASGITFNSGATFTQNCSGNIFGSGTANSIIFASGSTFIQFTGGNPFKLAGYASVVVFQTDSLFSYQGNAQLSTSGRIYADFEYNENATNTVTGVNALTISNLTVVQNTFTISMAGGFDLNGNASVASGATLNLNNTVATASGKIVTVNGTLGGTATISGSAAFVISSTGTLAPGSNSSIGTLTFATSPIFNGTNFMKIDRNGGAPLADGIILSSGTLNYGGTLIVTNIGAALQLGDTFMLFSANAFNNSFSHIQLPAGYTWNTSQLNVNGAISISPVAAPTIGSISISSGNIILNSVNGAPSGPVSVLTSTNLSQPLNQWTVLTNGNFDDSGSFTTTNAVDTAVPQQFYILQTQ